MNEHYRNTKRHEVLCRYCKNERLDYLYTLNELRNMERMTGICSKALRKLITGFRSRFRPGRRGN